MTAGGRESWQAGGRPCACGPRCAERDGGGVPAYGPRPFCGTDRAAIGAVIRRLPRTYTELHALLAPGRQRQEPVSGSRDGDPVNLGVEAFMRAVVHIAVSWEEQVRAVTRSSALPDGAVRDGVALTRACVLLAGTGHGSDGHLDTLLALPAEPKERCFPPDMRLRDLPPGARIRVDSAGDAWGETDLDGTGAGLEFLALHTRAQELLGLTRRRRRITAVPCDGCRGRTLVQYEAAAGGWEETARCTACAAVYTGAQYGLLMDRVLAAQAALPGRRGVAA